MATTYGIHRELEPQAPAVPPDVHLRRRKVMLVLGTLTASVSYSAVLTPPERFWLENDSVHTAGDPLLELGVTYLSTYKVFFYFNAVACLASLAVIALLSFPSNRRIEWYAQRVAMPLSLLGLIVSNYIAGSWLSFMAVLLYTAFQILALLFKPLKIDLSSGQRTPQKWPKLLRSEKKKNLLKLEQKDHVREMSYDMENCIDDFMQKLEQKDHGQQNILSDRVSSDAYQILKRSQMHLLLLGILTASVTYQAGLSPWGGFWQGKAAAGTHQHYLAGDSILHHYGKISRCRANVICRAQPHGKEYVAVRQMQAARQRSAARQSTVKAHGKDDLHGKAQERRTAKEAAQQNPRQGARQRRPHGKTKKIRTAKKVARQTYLCRAALSLPCAFTFFLIFII